MTRPDPLVFSVSVTRHDPVRPNPRMDPTRGQLWLAGQEQEALLLQTDRSTR